MRLIDADALISEMQETADVITRATGNMAGWTILMKFIEIVKRYPTIAPKRGRWINYPECLRYDGAYCAERIVCSNCESVWNIIDNDADRFDYCPHCGASMERSVTDETD